MTRADSGAAVRDRLDAHGRSCAEEAGIRLAGRLTTGLTAFPGIGPAGADIFLREVQCVWPEVAPYLDKQVIEGARRAGLPTGARSLSELAGSAAALPRFAALVRSSRGRSAA